MNGFDFDLNPFDDDEDAQGSAAAMSSAEVDAPLGLRAPSPFEGPETLLSGISAPLAEHDGALDGLRAALGFVEKAALQPDVSDHYGELDLQEQLADTKETAALLSTMSKAGHDINMGIIKNMG